MKLLLILLLMNAVSFILLRICLYLNGGLSAEVVIPRKKIRVENEKEIIFLSAGNLAQPREAFSFLRSELGRKQYAFLQFKMTGWSPLATAKEAAKVALDYDEAAVWSISVGDHVARHMEALLFARQLKVYTINPCPTRRALRKELRGLLLVAAPIFWILCHLLGWISIIPLMPATGGRYSLILLADQYMVITYSKPPKRTERTQGVILSTQDELLDNGFLEEYFANTEIVRIPTRHGDTVGRDYEYLRGAKKLLEL